MDDDAFLDALVASVARDNPARALDLARSVFNATALCLPPPVRERVRAGLPPGVQNMWKEADEGRFEPALRAAFLGRVAATASLDPGDAERVTRAVYAVLRRALPADAAAKVHEALPGGVRELWAKE